MINMLIAVGFIITSIILSVISTKHVIDSLVHTAAEKRKMIIFIWVLPIIGPLMAAARLKEGAIQHRKEMDKAMIDELNKLTHKIDGIREQVEKQKRKNMH